MPSLGLCYADARWCFLGSPTLDLNDPEARFVPEKMIHKVKRLICGRRLESIARQSRGMKRIGQVEWRAASLISSMAI